MKILLLVSQFYPHTGGVEVAVYNLARALLKQSSDVTVVTAKAPWSLPSVENVDDLLIKRYFLALPKTIKSALVFPFLFPLTVIKLWRLIKSQKIDVLNIHFADDAAFYALILKYLTGVRLVVSLHGNDVEKFPVESFFRRWLLRCLLKVADSVTVNSRYLEDRLQKKVEIIGNGINLDEFSTIQPFSHPNPYILFLGRLVYKKGVDLLIQAYAAVCRDLPFDLLIAGDGQERRNLEDLVKKRGMGDRIKFLGQVENKFGHELMAGASLFVVPSRLEPFGIVVLEAMATGCPVLASRTGGLTEIIQDGQTGVLFSSEDVVDLSTKLLELLLNPTKMERLKTAAWEGVQKYTWDVVARKYLEIYEH